MKDGVRKAIRERERQAALIDLVHAIGEFRKACDQTVQDSGYAHAVHELNKGRW